MHGKGAYVCLHVVGGQLAGVPPSTIWALGIELRLSGLAAGTFTHQAISLALGFLSFVLRVRSKIRPNTQKEQGQQAAATMVGWSSGPGTQESTPSWPKLSSGL